MHKKQDRSIWILNILSQNCYLWLFLLTVLFTNMRQNVVTNFDCEICSDKAGYYCFLPATFYYGFSTAGYPDNIDADRGYGFQLNQENNKLTTKFTSGVALLQFPFYGTGFIMDAIFSLKNTPFSKYYLVWMSIGSSFYLVLGIYFFRRFLGIYYSSKAATITTIITFLGTNLLYYTLDENLMSHLYSFTFFSILLFNGSKLIKTQKQEYLFWFIISLSLAILIRPTNILFAPLCLFIAIEKHPISFRKIRMSISYKTLFSAVFVGLLFATPQILYWKFAYGKWIVWSYTGEGFSNALTPQFMEVWFSPQGGLFIYTPLVMIALIISLHMIIQSKIQGKVVLLTFILVSYLCASWHTPFFGECNFGKRPFVEFYPILMLPFAYFIDHFTYASPTYKLLLFFVPFCILNNLLLFGVFDTCFFGGIWDWEAFHHLVREGYFISI